MKIKYVFLSTFIIYFNSVLFFSRIFPYLIALFMIFSFAFTVFYLNT